MTRVLKIVALSLLLAVLLGSSMVEAHGRIILAVTLIRHGDREPVHQIPASPENWTLGELTPLGINQEYILGQSLRARYIDDLQLLAPRYECDSIYACSTNYNRTIMSALACLCGLYPPGTGPLLDDGRPALPSAYQLIPVRTLSEDKIRQLFGQMDQGKKFREMLPTYVFSSAEWQKMNLSFAPRFDRWSQIFGVKIANLLDLIPPADNLNVRLLKNIALPEGLRSDEAREIVKLSHWAMAQEYRPPEIARLLAGIFLQEVITYMQKTIDGTQAHKFILFSGHDSNILPVMAALGSPLEATPPYASNICFELYRNEDGYSVKVRYNGEDITIACSGGNKECTFEQFKSAFMPVEAK
jgi:lysosomal acid phosphatase